MYYTAVERADEIGRWIEAHVSHVSRAALRLFVANHINAAQREVAERMRERILAVKPQDRQGGAFYSAEEALAFNDALDKWQEDIEKLLLEGGRNDS